ncbi:CHAT domain-containing protein [Amycolatopsis sp. NPDC004747]
MTTGCEFRITVVGNEVRGETLGPDGETLVPCGTGELQTDPHLEMIRVLEQWLRRWQTLTRLDPDEKLKLLVPETFNVLGDHLWKMAFDNDVGTELLERYRKLKDKQLGYMRVRISFSDDSLVATLPWEFLRYPGVPGMRAFFLASELNLVLGRYVDGFPDKKILPADDKVRVLFVTSLPESFTTAREESARLIAHLRADERTRRSMQIEQVDRWDAEKIDASLGKLAQDGKPVDVVHLTALFRIQAGTMSVYLPRPGSGVTDGETAYPVECPDSWQQPDTFVETLSSYPPTLLILALSDWEGEFPEHFEQLAPQFVVAGVPAVLAMQYPMSSDQGHLFLTGFYSAMTAGDRIGEAVQTGRRAMRLRRADRHFGTPVLYTQSARDARLMKAPDRTRDIDEEATVSTFGVAPLRQPTATPPAPQQIDVGKRLLDALADLPPGIDQQALALTRTWIADVKWSDVKSARLAIHERRRKAAPDDGFQEIARYLNRALRDVTTEAGS